MALGYGMPGSELMLNLVYNPVGPSLPTAAGEARKPITSSTCAKEHGIEFHHLLTITKHADSPLRGRPATPGQARRLHGTPQEKFQSRHAARPDVPLNL